ncbi:MAG: ATP12 family protein [Pseudolabrys sp.]
MREILTELFENRPQDPMVSARQGSRPVLRKRFYAHATVAEQGGAFAVRLDGKQVMTPARRALAAPSRQLAETMAQEWDAQKESIEPARMPLTRLANVVIDAVAAQRPAIADEVAKYFGTDLLCYRADTPPALVARQSEHWDPVLTWATEKLGARFALAQGVIHVAQPLETIAAARNAVPADEWRLGAVASITVLTGSGLLALALSHGAITPDAAWSAAHVDENWQLEFWGGDQLAAERIANRRAEFDAAALVLRHVSSPLRADAI